MYVPMVNSPMLKNLELPGCVGASSPIRMGGATGCALTCAWGCMGVAVVTQSVVEGGTMVMLGVVGVEEAV